MFMAELKMRNGKLKTKIAAQFQIVANATKVGGASVPASRDIA
jgi:hypothetical protein